MSSLFQYQLLQKNLGLKAFSLIYARGVLLNIVGKASQSLRNAAMQRKTLQIQRSTKQRMRVLRLSALSEYREETSIPRRTQAVMSFFSIVSSLVLLFIRYTIRFYGAYAVDYSGRFVGGNSKQSYIVGLVIYIEINYITLGRRP